MQEIQNLSEQLYVTDAIGAIRAMDCLDQRNRLRWALMTPSLVRYLDGHGHILASCGFMEDWDSIRLVRGARDPGLLITLDLAISLQMEVLE